MRFHVPDIDANLPEQTWRAIRRHLADMGMATRDRRIARLRFNHDGARTDAGVDGRYPGTRDHVLLIPEGEEHGVHYVCTPTRGVVSGRPYWIDQADAEAVPFEET